MSEEEFAQALRTGVEAVMTLGGAAPGDKTMIDALVPAVDALPHGFAAARSAAEAGAIATTPCKRTKDARVTSGAQHRAPGPGRHVLVAAHRRAPGSLGGDR